MADSRTPLEDDRFYHIYNHAVGFDKLFIHPKNYLYFLKLFSKYLSGFVDVYAYCLMPNHFHFVIKVKSKNEISEYITNIPKIIQTQALRGLKTLPTEINIPTILSKQLSHFFNSYAQAINKQESRKGSLFNNRYKRKPIMDDVYLRKLIQYIHYNPVKANLCSEISGWPYSSYNAIISDKATLISRNEVIALFGDKQNFIYCHQLTPGKNHIE